MLTAETTRARVSVGSWQEAVRAATQLLVDAAAIVLLHARPEDGVRRPCLALLSLMEPVAFGHSVNDPVDLVVAFGAVDKEAHLDALQQLAQLLSDPFALAALRAAATDQALLDALRAGTRDRMGNDQ
jgi:mannitol/fructose-specific phosphotransferase system IIA component (Ntr-type)